MNGARSTHMRRGYLFTALAAAVLLAASSGTALAQVTITAPATVDEGDSATVSVTLKGFIAAATGTEVGDAVAADTATVTAAISPGSTAATGGEAEDISTQLGLEATFQIPENATTNAVPFTATRTLSVQTLHDVDAENELFDWSFTAGQTLVAFRIRTGTPSY